MADTTDTTTITSGQAAIVQQDQGYGDVLRQGSLKEQTVDERLADARDAAIVNHDLEHKGDDESYEQTISNDKVEDGDDDGEETVEATTTESTTEATTTESTTQA